MFKKIVNLMLITFALNLVGVVLMQQAFATPADQNFEHCLLDQDSESSSNGNVLTCCVAVDAFFKQCTSCLTGSAPGTSTCRTSTTMVSKDVGGNPPAPKSLSLRDRLKQQQTPAPVKVMSPAKTPTVTPIKEYKQIKAPTKAVQTMGK